MRAVSFISGLLLTTAVVALPAPRPGNSFSDATPMDMGLGKRVDLPKLPSGLPSTDAVTAELGDVTSKLPVKLPVVRDLPVKLPALPTDSITDEVEDAAKPVTGGLPKLPVRRALTDVGSDLAPVTSVASPLVKQLGGILNSAISSLLSADAGVQTLIADAKTNVAPTVATVTADLNGAVEEVQNYMKAAESDSNFSVDEVQKVLGQLETTATQLVADLEKLDSALPGVPDLVATAKSLVATIQGLGL